MFAIRVKPYLRLEDSADSARDIEEDAALLQLFFTPKLNFSDRASVLEPIGRKQFRILVADDNEINQKLSLRLLEKLGYMVDVATDGNQALEMAQGKWYDLILMDIQMPVMDGLEAARRILKELPSEEKPIIVAMTANVLTGERERCLEAGMKDFISKPVQLETLKKMIERYCVTPSVHYK
jgi:CheY-like chemotaxis protein